MSIYLNNAATTWPKPPEVSRAMIDFMLNDGANASRGTSSLRDMNTMNMILDCRIRLAELFGGYDPTLVTFCMNITHAINIILLGFCRPAMNIITTSMEHNAVMRPLRLLECQGVNVSVLKCDPVGRLNPITLRDELSRTHYDLMIMSHASNVCGTLQTLEDIADICRKFRVPLVLDAAQTAGAIDINASELGLAAMCFTGHKGLMGPQGIGGIIWSPDFAQRVEPVITGGTGSFSHMEQQPSDMPDKFEAGTQNLPGIAGLNAALQWLCDTGIDTIARKEQETRIYLLEKLKDMKNITLHGQDNNSLPVISLNAKNIDNATLALELSDMGFETRPGLHCAPSAHKTLNTFPEGTLRISPGYFNTIDDIDCFVSALRRVAP